MKDVFELCKEHSNDFVFSESFCKVVDNKIVDTDWSFIKFGMWDNIEDVHEELSYLSDLDVEDGYYGVKCLMTVEMDYDDYRQWYYLEISDFELKKECTIEEYEGSLTDFDDILTDFNIFGND